MKKTSLFLVVILGASTIFATNNLPFGTPLSAKNIEIPTTLLTSNKTSVVQWGCPVMEVISANSSAEALDIVSEACMNEAKKEVVKKPGVFDVIRVSVVWPDVNVEAQEDGYLLKGTFFLETLVLKSKSGE